MGNGGGGCCADDPAGVATETVCPPASTLTYENFGKAFVESYCTRCHSTAKTGDARMGAPAFHDFDSLLGIQQVTVHIDRTTGSGPAGTNEVMPPSDPKPTLEERQKLAEWIACGAP